MRIVLLYTDRDPWALGMRSVSSVLKKAGRPTRLIFAGSAERFYSPRVFEQAKNLVQDFDLIGISCLARGSEKAKQIIKHLRPLKKLIVWGGVHATLNPHECLDWADLVCRGEGEEMMLELTEKLQEGNLIGDPTSIYNLRAFLRRKLHTTGSPNSPS